MNESDYIKFKKACKKLARTFHKINPSLSDSFEEEFTRGDYRYNVKVTRKYVKAKKGGTDEK